MSKGKVDDGSDALTTLSSVKNSSARPTTSFHVLCSVCKSILAQRQRNTFYQFHSLANLRVSAEDGCHLCSLLIREARWEGTLMGDVKDGEPCQVEIRYYTNVGAAFMLFNGLRDISLAEISFLYEPDHKIEDMRYLNSKHTGSAESWNQVLKWISQCTESHTRCRHQTAAVSKGQWPKRVIAVGGVQDPQISICETSDLETPTLAYITLSHCWGNIVPIRLLVENYAIFLHGVELSTLPQTFRDAVTVTRRLNVKYLWIDSLCIIQDSVDDWAGESSRMHRIYQNSYLNISAAASLDSTGGLFQARSPLSITPVFVELGQESNTISATSRYLPELCRLRGCLGLMERGWVLQEWLLAPRVLSFGKEELHWVCHEIYGSELFPKQEMTIKPDTGDVQYACLRRDWREVHLKGHQQRCQAWKVIIEEYSKKKLSKFSDKLVSIAGLASDLGRNWDGATYLCGLWSYRLRQSLLWTTDKKGISQAVDKPYNTPSWSWASWDNSILTYFYADNSEGLAEVLESNVQLKLSSNPYGAVISGLLKIKGPLVAAEITLIQKLKFSRSLYEIVFHGFGRYSPSGHKIWLEAIVVLDNMKMEENQVIDVFLAPLEIFLEFQSSRLGMNGLILSPTLSQDGQFRRIGLFKVVDDWRDRAGEVHDYDLLNYDAEIAEDHPYVPLLEIRSARIALSKLPPTLYSIQKLSPPPGFKEKLEGRMNTLNMRFTDDEGVQELQPTPEDPYCNGVVDTTLVDRFEKELGSRYTYPVIHTFLLFTYLAAENHVDMGLLSEEKFRRYGKYHGGGFFTYEIV